MTAVACLILEDQRLPWMCVVGMEFGATPHAVSKCGAAGKQTKMLKSSDDVRLKFLSTFSDYFSVCLTLAFALNISVSQCQPAWNASSASVSN
jgi:hypothetical protein